MSSLAVGCGLEWELWLGGLFTAADLAAADLLLQLRLGEAEAAAFTMTSSSQRSASSCCEDLAVDAEEERIVKETAMSLGRARKRYRLLSELYAATRPAKAAAPAAKKKRKRRHDGGVSESEEATRYGDY
ncbi:hypothetical protein TRIUR3_35471 [Triticum urartu]|uniref:Uncharacterized protein n=1 Tax=Triticum urartu TaxID=4572 RepID=M7Z081_TRIUA|nr:hypothetical protein TRIUR3_35471 [Triticum urartu]